MKKFILTICAVLTLSINSQAWWWDDDDDDNQQQVEQQKQEITRLQNEVDQQEHTKDTWQVIAFVLGVGCCGMLIIGAAMGSYARRNLKEEHQ